MLFVFWPQLSNVKLHSALCSEKYSSLADHVPQAELFQFVEKFKKNHGLVAPPPPLPPPPLYPFLV